MALPSPFVGVVVSCGIMDMLVSSALEADSSLPSFFEMFMTQQVEQSLKPAARHAHRYPARVSVVCRCVGGLSGLLEARRSCGMCG